MSESQMMSDFLTPGSEFVVYENSAHMPHWEETDRYLKVVRGFLKRAETG